MELEREDSIFHVVNTLITHMRQKNKVQTEFEVSDKPVLCQNLPLTLSRP